MVISAVTYCYKYILYIRSVKYNLMGVSHSEDKAIVLLTKDTEDLMSRMSTLVR